MAGWGGLAGSDLCPTDQPTVLSVCPRSRGPTTVEVQRGWDLGPVLHHGRLAGPLLCCPHVPHRFYRAAKWRRSAH